MLGWTYYIFSFAYMGSSSDCSSLGNKWQSVRFRARNANSELVFKLRSRGVVCPLGPFRDRMPFPEVGRYSRETVGTLWWFCVSRLGKKIQTERHTVKFKVLRKMSPQNVEHWMTQAYIFIYICIHTSLLVGGKSKSFSKFEYLLEFLNKENYDFHFTSWLHFDKGRCH